MEQTRGEQRPTAKALLQVTRVRFPKATPAVQILAGREEGSELPEQHVTEGLSPSRAGLWSVSGSSSFPGTFVEAVQSWINKSYQQ